MSTTLTRRGGAAALLAGLALAVAACNSSGGTTAPTNAAASPAGGAVAASDQAPTPAAATPAAPTAVPAATDQPSAPAAASTLDPFATISKDKNLEARLPDAFGGVKLTKLSLTGADMPTGTETGAFLKSIGKTPADLSLAIATPATAASANETIFMAIRVKGASEDQLKQMFQLSAQQQAAKAAGVKLEATSIGGVDVFKSTDTATGQTSYFVVRGDTALGVSGSTDAGAQKAFAALAK